MFTKIFLAALLCSASLAVAQVEPRYAGTIAREDTNSARIARGEPLRVPAGFEKREVNGVSRMIPRHGSRTLNRRQAQPSTVPVVTLTGFIQYTPNTAGDNTYAQTDYSRFGSYGFRTRADPAWSPLQVTLTSSGFTYGGYNLYYMAPDTPNGFGPYMCVASNAPVATIMSTWESYLDGCAVQEDTRTGPYEGILSSANHPYTEYLFAYDPLTGAVLPIWFNSAASGELPFIGTWNSFIDLAQYSNNNGGNIYLVSSVPAPPPP